MTRKTKAPPWRRGFLRVLARTGNVKLSAREAGVDHSTAYYHRKTDARFAAAWGEALKKAESGLRGINGNRPSPRPSPASGRGSKAGELIVRQSKRHGAQLVRVGAGRWNGAAERAFFGELGRTACVRRAAEACGFSTTALYKRRDKYADFAGRWDAVEEAAKARILSYLVSATIATFDPELAGEGLPRVSVSEGIAIYRLKGPGSALGSGAKPGLRYGPPAASIEEVRANILRKLDAIEAHEKKKVDPGSSPG